MEFTSGWMNGINNLLEWIFRLAYINLLWIFFTLIGGIVLGITPATVAMFSVIRQWIKGEGNNSIIRTFFNFYKRDFKQANILGLLLMIVGLFLYVDAKLITNFDGFIKYILLSSYVTVSVFYILILLYVFPVFVQFKNNIFQYLKSALLIGISYPLRTIMMCFSVISVLFICFIFPTLTLLFLGSGLSATLMFFSHHLFIKISEEQPVLK